MMGRTPKPTAVKRLNGNPGRRAFNAKEPQFGAAASCPKHLDKVAKNEWKRMSKELAAQGLLTSADCAAFGGYCAAYSRWIQAEKQVQEFGAVLKSPKSGYPIPNPAVGIANSALGIMHRFLVEFGMTPASRSRISIAESKDKGADAFSKFMSSLSSADTQISDEPTEDLYLQ